MFLSISSFIWIGRNDLLRRLLLSSLDFIWRYHLLSFVWSLGILREMSTISSNLHLLIFHSFLSLRFDLCLYLAKAVLRKVYKDLLYKLDNMLKLHPHSIPWKHWDRWKPLSLRDISVSRLSFPECSCCVSPYVHPPARLRGFTVLRNSFSLLLCESSSSNAMPLNITSKRMACASVFLNVSLS